MDKKSSIDVRLQALLFRCADDHLWSSTAPKSLNFAKKSMKLWSQGYEIFVQNSQYLSSRFQTAMELHGRHDTISAKKISEIALLHGSWLTVVLCKLQVQTDDGYLLVLHRLSLIKISRSAPASTASSMTTPTTSDAAAANVTRSAAGTTVERPNVAETENRTATLYLRVSSNISRAGHSCSSCTVDGNCTPISDCQSAPVLVTLLVWCTYSRFGVDQTNWIACFSSCPQSGTGRRIH